MRQWIINSGRHWSEPNLSTISCNALTSHDPHSVSKPLQLDSVFHSSSPLSLTCCKFQQPVSHYSDAIMRAVAFQITGVSIVCSLVCSGADQRKHQSSASLAFVRGIHRSPMDSPHKGPVTRKMFPFDDVIMGFMAGTLIDTWTT